jgi:hypothetical protein
MSWVPYVSAFLAATSAGAHAVAMSELRRSSYPWTKAWFFMSLAAFSLSCVYTVAYVYLVMTDIGRGEWSETLAYVSLLTWPLVWILPACVVAFVARSRRRLVQ